MQCFFVTNSDHLFTIFHQNIQGLLSKKEILELTFSNIRTNINPDVVCLTETFVRNGDEKNININNFKLASNYSRDTKRGGSCILIKKGLEYKKVTCFDNLSIAHHFECCSINLIANGIIVVCIYRIPSKKKKDIDCFLGKLDLLLHKCLLKFPKHKLIIAGDLNINILINSPSSERLKNILIKYNLKLHINVPTRGNACLDHIASNIDNAIGSVLTLWLSDHDTAQVLKFEVKQKNKIPDSVFTYKKCYSVENLQKFKKHIGSLSFSNIYDQGDLNHAFDEFYDMLLLIYNLCFPSEKSKCNTSPKPQWMTKGLKKSCIMKKTLRYKYYSTKCNENRSKYINYTKLFKKCINLSKRIANQKFVTKSKNICKATWTVIKRETSGSNAINCINNIIFNDKEITEPAIIASTFNNYFINEACKVNNNTKENTVKTHLLNSIFLKPVDEEYIKKVIVSLKNTQSVGYDDISTNVIKLCKDELSQVLTFLVNLSLQTGQFPQKLKVSIVKPLFKKGDKRDITNYRPIALLPILSKIFERVMHDQLTNFFNNFDIIKQCQYGFQKNKSTTHAAFDLVNEVMQSANRYNYTTIVLLDMSKAFDCVSFDILLSKLERSGIRGPALNWLKSYLTNRSQYVEITQLDSNSTTQVYRSDKKYNKYGVPQGSVLGPLLFILYINDLPNILKQKTILFADDVSIIVSTDKSFSLEHHKIDIINTLTSVIEWLDKNNLKINISKTNLINFNNFKNKSIDINFNGQILRNADKATFLGLILDSKLSWKDQIEKTRNKINGFAFALYKLAKVANVSTAITAYYAYVESILRYGLIIWGNGSDIKKLFTAQKRCIRAICNIAPDISCLPYFKSLQILTLPCLYIFEVGVFVKQNIRKFKQAKDLYTRSTRNCNRLVLEVVPKTERFQNNSYAMCRTIYNKIPMRMKELELNAFKTSLRKWLLDNAYYSVDEFLKHKGG